MSDDRLFASNNPIGRRWYYINIVILLFISVITNFIFQQYVLPNVKNDLYYMVANGIMYFLFFMYFITFFSLIERRIYDLSGTRDAFVYKILSGTIFLIIFYQIFMFASPHIEINVPLDINLLKLISSVLYIIFVIITLAIGLFKGKISELSYEEYQNKIKYQ